MLNAFAITAMHDQSTQAWHQSERSEDTPDTPDTPETEGVMGLAQAQHRANFDLWHEEDKARDPNASDAEIVAVKHAIDRLNQLRNDLVEKLDGILLTQAGQQNPAAPLHSETPGLIIDRLSILALKIYHTEEETHRESATEAHRQKNVERLALLREQRSDLAGCLDALWSEVLACTRRFKLYRQMKMYNDPELNPKMYGSGHTAKADAG
jgi:hypothetical protein